MESEGEGRRVTRQSLKETYPAVATSTKRKSQSTGSSNVKKGRRQCRPKRGEIIGTTDSQSVTDNSNIKQESWSSSLGNISDDEDLPPAVLASPAKTSNGQIKTFKKHDIVWIKHGRDEYRPCLITSILKDLVRFKYIYGKRNHVYKTRLHKVIGFDDPDKNNELLNIGRKVNPHIVDAYERARLYFCRLSEQHDLSPLKYLFCDKTEDLLYGIVPELKVVNNDTVEKHEDAIEDEYDCPVFECSDNDEEENENKDNKENNKQCNGEKDEIYDDIYGKMAVDEKAKLLEYVKILLKTIAREDCVTYLKQIVEGTIESSRMKLLNSGKELDLQMKSGGLGPFYAADTSETDELLHIMNNHANTLQFDGDSSILVHHVLIPEAIIYSLHKEWDWNKEKAEAFFMEWTFRIPDWKPKETDHQNTDTTA